MCPRKKANVEYVCIMVKILGVKSFGHKRHHLEIFCHVDVKFNISKLYALQVNGPESGFVQVLISILPKQYHTHKQIIKQFVQNYIGYAVMVEMLLLPISGGSTCRMVLLSIDQFVTIRE